MAKNYEQLTLFDMDGDEKNIEIEDKGVTSDVTNHVHFSRSNTD